MALPEASADVSASVNAARFVNADAVRKHVAHKTIGRETGFSCLGSTPIARFHSCEGVEFPGVSTPWGVDAPDPCTWRWGRARNRFDFVEVRVWGRLGVGLGPGLGFGFVGAVLPRW